MVDRTEGQVPPNDLDAEAAILSASSLAEDALAVAMSFLRPEHFYADANRRIFEALLGLESTGTPRDILTIKAWLSDRDLLQRVGGVKYLGEILDATPSIAPDHVEEYARRIIDKYRVRQVITSCRRYAAEGYGDVGDVSEWVDSAEQSLFAIASERSAHQPQSIKQIISEHYIDVQARMTQQAGALVTTGLRSLDQQIIGVCAPNLVVIAARPGMGKTSMASGFVRNVARKHGGVAMFSLEMSRQEMADQMVCAEALIDSRAMARVGMGMANVLTKDDWSRITASAADLSKLPLWIDDEAGIGLTGIRAKARRIAAEFKRQGTELRLIVVDYLQLMGVNAKASSREQQVSENSRGLKILAKDLGVPVVALAQLNRAIETRGKKQSKPQLSDLRESGAIEQDADQVWFIWRDENDGGDVAQVCIAKGRRFGTGDVRVKWTPCFTRFDDLSENDQYASSQKDNY